MRRPTTSRAGERGFTLVEVLVSMALLSIIGTVIGVVFSVGMSAILSPGASRDRLASASDAIAIQQLLAQDVHRATCVQVPSSGVYGSCAAETPSSQFDGQCTSSELCIEWPDLATPGQCDMALYTLSPVSRSAWSGGTEGGATTYMESLTASLTSGAAGSWPVVLDLSVTSTNSHLANPPTLTFDLQPLATKPWPTDPVSDTGTSPC
ncbi:MAG: type II secretion system protein J [Candidatus Dormibacteria bacterium]